MTTIRCWPSTPPWKEFRMETKNKALCALEKKKKDRPSDSQMFSGKDFYESKFLHLLIPSSVQFSHSVMSDSLWLHVLQHARPPCPSPTPGVHPNSCVSSQWCHPSISSSVIPFSSCPNSSSIRVFYNESTLRMRWPKYWISASAWVPGLISSRMDWLDLLAVQGTLKSLLQHHSLKASILWRSAFFTVQLSYPYMTTGKTIALTRWTLVSKVMSLLLNMLSRLLITSFQGVSVF